jgi:hypothetical protein
MLTHLGAILAAALSVAETLFGIRLKTSAGLAVTALILGACTPTMVLLAGADPADPNARVAGVGYRSTIAPYNSLRPTAPSSWRQQNDRVSPAPKSGQ